MKYTLISHSYVDTTLPLIRGEGILNDNKPISRLSLLIHHWYWDLIQTGKNVVKLYWTGRVIILWKLTAKRPHNKHDEKARKADGEKKGGENSP